MPSPSYTPTVWHNDADPPIEEELLNHLEDGVESAHERIDAFDNDGGWEPGDIKMGAYPAADPGWLLCNGAAVSRATYADLFGRISTAYGAGDGTTTFNLPDLRGRVPVGVGTHIDVDALGDSDGITSVGNRRPKHKSSVNEVPHTHGGAFQKDGGGVYLQSNPGGNNGMQPIPPASTGITVGPQTGAEPVDQPAYVVLNFFIKT